MEPTQGCFPLAKVSVWLIEAEISKSRFPRSQAWFQRCFSDRAEPETAHPALTICADNCGLWWCFQAVVSVCVSYGLGFFSSDGRGSCTTGCSAILGLTVRRASAMGSYSREKYTLGGGKSFLSLPASS